VDIIIQLKLFSIRTLTTAKRALQRGFKSGHAKHYHPFFNLAKPHKGMVLHECVGLVLLSFRARTIEIRGEFDNSTVKCILAMQQTEL
jgi:hypothetical protein